MENSSMQSVTRRKFLAEAGGAVGSFALLSCVPTAAGAKPPTLEAFIVPNTHDASCGWLVDFSTERIYDANNYLDYLDKVRDDPTFKFVFSECNNLITIMDFQPQRIDEIKQRMKEGRVELVNATFLEPAVNLSGGEALIKQGVEGLRWQEQVMGAKPRFAWMIDTCGLHDQIAQLCSGWGIEAMAYTRRNPTGSTIHWIVSPDGSRVLAFCPGDETMGLYSDFGPLFKSEQALTPKEFQELEDRVRRKSKVSPAGAPILILAGNGDASLAPVRKEYPREFLEEWKQNNPNTNIRIATASEYLDAVLPGVRSGKFQIPTLRGGTGYAFDAFWIQCPRVKTWFRKNEHGIQAAETLATIASLNSDFLYPVDRLYKAWIMMLLNMDRNSLWGAAVGGVFESKTSWDVRDRMEAVERTNDEAQAEALAKLVPAGEGLVLFNPLNWERRDPLILNAGQSKSLHGCDCQGENGELLCSATLPSLGAKGFGFSHQKPASVQRMEISDLIETTHYSVRIDANTGALVSLKLKPSGREILGGPANVVVVERTTSKQQQAEHMLPRPERVKLGSSSDSKSSVTVIRGPVATTVEVTGKFFGGGAIRRRIRLYKNYPRIDFETELNDIPDHTVVVAEFPLATDVDEVRRAVPGGFSHGAWAKPNPALTGWTKGIVPAVGWIDYSLAGGGGVAILDRGLSGRELNGRVPIIYLLNVTERYWGLSSMWTSGAGQNVLSYALVAHEESWEQACIPRMAWEYNSPPIVLTGRKLVPEKSWLRTSDNLIVSVIRREEKEIEIRLTECLGHAGTAEVTVNLPHSWAALTDLLGKRPRRIEGGPTYRFPVAPQQIVTMRFGADTSVDEIKPVLKWDDLVPPQKLEALHRYGSYKGHAPFGT